MSTKTQNLSVSLRIAFFILNVIGRRREYGLANLKVDPDEKSARERLKKAIIQTEMKFEYFCNVA